MFGQSFELNHNTLPVVEEIGKHMPGGFFIYRSDDDGRLIYANHAVIKIFGCSNIDEFTELTGSTFKGMLHPDDYALVRESVDQQLNRSSDSMNRVEYRIIRKDGKIRWVEDYGHYTQTEAYGGIHYVFISDITEKRQQMETDAAIRQAVTSALSESYHTVWLINDVETESFSLYRGDIKGSTAHALPIQDALQKMKYSDAKDYYIRTTVSDEDQERLQTELTIENLVSKLNQRSQFNINYLRKMDDGSERYFRIEFARMNMPEGKMGIVCGFKDVDEYIREGQAVQKAILEAKKTEAENIRLMEQVESAAKLANFMGSVASLLTNMPAMSFSKDAAAGIYLACNQAFAEYAHKDSPEGVIGLTDHDIFDKDTADHFAEDDKTAVEMNDPYIFFEDVPDAAGNPRSFQTTKMKFTDSEGRLCILGMCVDVTEMSHRKAAEAEARIKQQELEEKLLLQEKLLLEEKRNVQQSQMITAMASDYRCVYYVTLDDDKGICYRTDHIYSDSLDVGDVFDFYETFSAYAEKHVDPAYRKGFIEFIDPCVIRKRLAKELIISYRYLLVRDGEEKYEMLRIAGVRRPEDRDDHIVHAVGIGFTDIDAEMRETMARNEALRDALTAAEEANKAKTAFLSNMSHEIRTPMNAIIGLDNIALNDPDISEKTREHLEKIGASAQHLLNIINDILDMSRIESGRMIIKQEEFPLFKALEQVNTIISGQCREKGLNYKCNINGTLDDFYIGDDMKLRQIMINILGNSVKFTPEGGNVTFTIEEIAHFEDNATLRFTMSDTGIGMSKEFIPRIFDSFSQEDSSTTSRFGSTGLGMAITKNLVDLMNGKIEVESEKGVGSTFTVTVTLGKVDQYNETEHDSLLPDPTLLSALIIDDDPVDCEHARLVLGQAGLHCETAMSGIQAVDMVKLRNARREPYDLILVDWKMPEMDGIETTRKIRSLVGNDSAIIILTAYNWDDIAEEAKLAGVDSFAAKPVFAGTVMEEFKKACKIRNNISASLADLEGRRILLAEDVPVNAEIMLMILEMRNMKVDIAQNGRIATELFRDHPEGYYDAILMDMRMPEMDGLEATACIRSMGRSDSGSIPIIALTANAFDDDVQRSLQAGLNAHLSKPVEPEILYKTLENLIK